MGKLNAPREIPYEFKVFELDEVVWLFDESSRSFPCTAVPHIYAEPLYWTNQDYDGEPMPLDGSLFRARDVEKLASQSVELWDEDISPDIPDQEAWDSAREEAQANHYI